MKLREGALLLVLLPAGPLLADSAMTAERTVTRLADGVWEIRHADPFYGWVNGNTTVVIGDREVLVVDSTNVSWEARADIEQIRKWTALPVRWLVNTHWHQDHNSGNHDYAVAFPGVAILAHAETKTMMDATYPKVAQDEIRQAEEAVAQAKKRLAEGKTEDGKPLTDRQRQVAEHQLAQAPPLLEHARQLVYVAPTLTFEDHVTIDLGGRIVEVVHPGRGNTGGDLVVYLPREKILAAGDLVVHPVLYPFDGYPSEWIHTLERLAAYPADTIVPGHGELLHDDTYVLQLRDLMRSVVDQVETAIRADDSLELEAVKNRVDVRELRARILGDDTVDGPFFDYAVGSLVELCFHEAKLR